MDFSVTDNIQVVNGRSGKGNEWKQALSEKS